MAPISYYWEIFTSIVYSVTLSPFSDTAVNQHPIGPSHDLWQTQVPAHVGASDPLVFRPHGSNIDDFQCDYSRMVGWRPCHSKTNASCWLESDGNTEYNNVTGFPNKTFDIHTNYEAYAPWGRQRNITLFINDGWVNADGINFTEAKLFNNSFPGPLIEACWGDRVNVTVTNQLNMNGTTIHWHGIRQNQTMHMDGVNGVTQCPIAPNDTYSYIFNITQYGSSWYHSHHSVQYADGAHGPMTLLGPSIMNYDKAISPIIITDWFHNSAFEVLYTNKPLFPTMLLDGKGNITRFTNTATNDKNVKLSEIPPQFNVTVMPPDSSGATHYLIRLMNTAFQSAFVFSIDNHELTVVEADFVPVHPYKVTSLVVAIGQRYNIIVKAQPIGSHAGGNPIHEDWNFWIRTTIPPKVIGGCNEGLQSVCVSDVSPKCHSFTGHPKCPVGYNPLCPDGSKPKCPGFIGEFACPGDGKPVCSGICPDYNKAGILHYKNASVITDPSQVKSLPWGGKASLNPSCFDDLSENLKPVHHWKIGPANNTHPDPNGESFSVHFGVVANYGTAFVSLDGLDRTDIPFQTTYGNPTFLNLDNNAGYWQKSWMVIPENYTKHSWVYLVLNSNHSGTHPMHLHGHDFAILQTSFNASYDPKVPLKLNTDNPLRRDVVVLPSGGFVVIAFRTDNPGTWLMHCHIAFHASGGLALQILERQASANQIWPPGSSPALSEAQRVCANWNDWASNCTNAWPGNTGTADSPNWPACNAATQIQNDSGI